MILAIDVGNTNICVGVMEDAQIIYFARILSRRRSTTDEYMIQIQSILSRVGISAQELEGCIITSVVPQITLKLMDICEELCGSAPLLVGPEMDTGYTFAVPSPEKIGKDRLVDTAAALDLYAEEGRPVVTIDLGTATTISVISSQRQFIGGLIIPGVMTSFSALSEKAAQLPSIPLSVPDYLIGTSPEECMTAGIIHGTGAMLDGLLERLEEQLGQPPVAVMTGGLSKFIMPACRRPIIHDGNLLLKGLAVLYRRNQ